MIEVTGTDGKIHKFDDGTTTDVRDGALFVLDRGSVIAAFAVGNWKSAERKEAATA